MEKKRIHISLPKLKNSGEIFKIGALLITSALSIWAILEARSTRQFSEKQFLQSQKLVVINKMFYRENNVDIEKIEFISLKNDVSIERIELRFPKDYKGTNGYRVIGNTWSCYNIQAPILETLAKGFNLTQQMFDELGPLDVTYPVDIRFSYNQNGETKHFRGIFELYLRIYMPEKMKMTNLTFVKEISEQTASQELNDYYITESTGNYIMTATTEIDSLIMENKLFAPVLELINKGCCSREVTYNVGDTSIIFTVPDCFSNTDSARNFIRELNTFFKSKGDYPASIEKTIGKIKKFFDENPYCELSDSTCVINSNWQSENTYFDWKDLYREMMVAMYREIKRE